MIRKLLFVSLWFPITLVLILINLVILSRSVSAQKNIPLSAIRPDNGNFQVAAPGGTGKVLGASIEGADARSLLLESFLRQHDSPMTAYADYIVQKSDEKGIDFRLVVAISMCESNAGKRMPRRDSYNAWGIAVYTGQLSGANFRDWPHAIDWVTTYIKEKYYDKGLIDLKDIGAKWAPPSVNTGYSWTNCVEEFQSSIL